MGRERGLDDKMSLRDRVGKGKTQCVEMQGRIKCGMPGHGFLQLTGDAIASITDDRAVNCGQMGTQLVLPACFRSEGNQRGSGGSRLKNPIAGQGGFLTNPGNWIVSVAPGDPMTAILSLEPDGDGAHPGLGRLDRDGQIVLADGSRPEHLTHGLHDRQGLAQEQNTRCVLVKPVDEAQWIPVGSAGLRQQLVKMNGLASATLGSEACGLVDREEVIILKEGIGEQPCQCAERRSRGIRRLLAVVGLTFRGQADPLAGLEPCGAFDPSTIDADPSLPTATLKAGLADATNTAAIPTVKTPTVIIIGDGNAGQHERQLSCA